MIKYCDYLVIGSGVAGLTFALEMADHGHVVLITKRELKESNTEYAQGGIAAVLHPEDSFELHMQDTLIAGAEINHHDSVDVSVKGGPERINFLLKLGANFDKNSEGGIDLHLEGGHSARRIVHKDDATGREVERTLVDSIRKKAAENRIEILEEHMAIDLIMSSKYGAPEECEGAYVLDVKSGNVKTIVADETILATGGAGKVYLYTTNPDVATGDGVAMAYRAGAEIANMEFYQFHPTCLFHPLAKNFLITEALRGEGAILRRLDGTAFMEEYDHRKDLAPRDIVARAIDHEMKKTGAEHVYLDITHRGRSFVETHFPTIYLRCKQYGIDISNELIPVVPAAHYMCGGVTTGLEGQTTIPRLWAIGECAHTGLHGANRLASNSILEGLVYARRAAMSLKGRSKRQRSVAVSEWDSSKAGTSEEGVIVTQDWDELRRLMWNYVGIVRSDKRLKRAAKRIALLREEISEYYCQYFVTRDLLELRNIAVVAQLIVECAQARKESRGLHTTLNYPESDPAYARDVVVKRGVSASLR